MKFSSCSLRSIAGCLTGRLSALVSIMLVALPIALDAQRTPDGRVPLPESVRPVSNTGIASESVPVVSRSNLTDTEAATPLHVEAILKMRHFAELRRRVTLGETVSRAEMAARYLPLESDYQAVAKWMTAQGLTVSAAGASHAVVRATGKPAQLQQTFQTSFARVIFKGTEYTAAVSTPSLPAGIESVVANVHGLQPYLHPHKSGTVKKEAASSSIAPPYLVSDILTAYNVSTSGVTGVGQQIGIVIDTVPLDSDLTKFWTANGISQSLSNIITVNVTDANLPAPTGEETLDVSWSSGIASGAQIVIYACGDLSHVNEGYSRILDDLQDGTRPDLHQISMSYGAGEETEETTSDMKSVNELFTAISAYGVSLFASSGDYGAYGNGGRTVQVLYPASDPNVTGVGGTSLYLNTSTGAVTSETAWSATASASQGPGGGGDSDDAEVSSGGGVSDYFSRPSWQVGSTVPSGTKRLVPDVAFAADPNQGCYLVLDAQTVQYGGTSWSSPSWAGLCALINQARSEAGESVLTGANASLYPLVGTTAFRDITSGNNGPYDAGAGYDLVTGLGVPDFDVLLSSLTGNFTITRAEVAPTITSASAVAGTVNSAFSYQIAASNSPTSFAASGLPAGLSVDTSTGLISGTPTAVGVSTVTVSATNSGGTGSATLTLTVVNGSTPVVTLTATVPEATLSGSEVGEVTFSIPDALSSALTVYYTLKGSATSGTDYYALSGQTKIKAGKTSRTIKVVPCGDLGGASKKVVKIGMEPGDVYAVGSSGFVKIKILNE